MRTLRPCRWSASRSCPEWLKAIPKKVTHLASIHGLPQHLLLLPRPGSNLNLLPAISDFVKPPPRNGECDNHRTLWMRTVPDGAVWSVPPCHGSGRAGQSISGSARCQKLSMVVTVQLPPISASSHSHHARRNSLGRQRSRLLLLWRDTGHTAWAAASLNLDEHRELRYQLKNWLVRAAQTSTTTNTTILYVLSSSKLRHVWTSRVYKPLKTMIKSCKLW